MVDLEKPLVHATDGSGEITLATWAAVSSQELLERHTLIGMLTGVSARSYPTVLDSPASPIPPRPPSGGILDAKLPMIYNGSTPWCPTSPGWLTTPWPALGDSLRPTGDTRRWPFSAVQPVT